MIIGLATIALGATVDRVPQDFPTIQAAIDGGQGSEIHVASGHYAGATITRSVRIVGQGAIIDVGVPAGTVRAGLLLTGDAHGTSIEGFRFACETNALDLGVMASAGQKGTPDHVTVQGNTFNSCVQGVTNAGPRVQSCDVSRVDGGRFWTVAKNRFHNFATRSDDGFIGGGLGIMVRNAEFFEARENRFTGRVQDTSRFSTAGISLGGCWDCVVVGNDFRVGGGRAYWSAVNNLGFAQSGAAPSERLLLADNDALLDSAPHHGINFRSLDSFDNTLRENVGMAFVDHTWCGDDQRGLVEGR